MIRRRVKDDFQAIESIINEAAEAYHGVIPADCWHEPYMSASDLQAEIEAAWDRRQSIGPDTQGPVRTAVEETIARFSRPGPHIFAMQRLEVRPDRIRLFDPAMQEYTIHTA